jgi:hypothetical protein
MKVFWFVRAEQRHKSAGDTQFIPMLRCLLVQVYCAKKNYNVSNESSHVTSPVTSAVTCTVAVTQTEPRPRRLLLTD